MVTHYWEIGFSLKNITFYFNKLWCSIRLIYSGHQIPVGRREVPCNENNSRVEGEYLVSKISKFLQIVGYC